MTRLGFTLLFTVFASSAHAELVAQAGSGDWCQGYDATSSGVWFFPDGSEALLFRTGVTGDEGCYAWLNAVPQWGLDAGLGIGSAEQRGDATVISFPSGVEVHLFEDGRAEHRRQGFVTTGEIRNR
jgi:hypothetical protein